MNLCSMVNEKLTSFGYEAGTKDDVLHGLGQMMFDAGKVSDVDTYVKNLYKREAEFSTGIGYGFAIPHCKDDCVKEAAFTLVKLNRPIEWGETLDGGPVDYVIMLAAPNTSDNVHLKMLSKLAAALMEEDFRNGLKDAADMSQIIDIFSSIKEEES